MFAEKVFDGSFEGVPEYKVAFRRETDRIEQPWCPDGAVHRGIRTLASVPEPSTLAMLAGTLAALLLWRRAK